MLRDSSFSVQFKTTYTMIEHVQKYVAKKNPNLAKLMRKQSFAMLLRQINSPDKSDAVGGLMYLSNMMSNKMHMDLFDENSIETIVSVFGLMNRFSCRFHLTTQKKAHELCKQIMINYKENRKEDERVRMAAIKEMLYALVKLIPSNKQYEQKVLVLLISNILFEGLNKAQTFELVCGHPPAPEEKINITEVLAKTGNEKDRNLPIVLILEYVMGMLRNYKTKIENKGSMGGQFKELTFEDCSALTSVMMVANYLFKWKLHFKYFVENGFEKTMKEMMDIMLLLIQENMEFNEKKMNSKGSSVRLVPANERIIPGPNVPQDRSNVPSSATTTVGEEMEGQNRAQAPTYKINQEIYYQSLEYKIFVDDYDFQVQGWSVLVESIINFLANFLSKPEVNEYIRQRKAAQPQFGESEIMRFKCKIVQIFFELFARVEYRIRESIDVAFKQLLKTETVEKDIIPREQIEACFKPFLAFIQLQDPDRGAGINENSMYSFKKLFALFKTCFNASRLADKYNEYLKGYEKAIENNNYKEEEILHIKSIFSMYSLMVKNDDFQKFILRGISFENAFQDKGIYYASIKPKLEKLFIVQSALTLSGITKQRISSDSYFWLFLDTLGKTESYSVRERCCREDPLDFFKALRREMEQRTSEEEIRNLIVKRYRWSLIQHVLLKRVSWFMSMNKNLLLYYHEQVLEQFKELSNIDLQIHTTAFGTMRSDEFVLNLKILIKMLTFFPDALTTEKLNVMFDLVVLPDIKVNLYINFIKTFFKNVLPKAYPHDIKKKAMLKYLEIFRQSANPDVSVSPIANNHLYIKTANINFFLPLVHWEYENVPPNQSILYSKEVILTLSALIPQQAMSGDSQSQFQGFPQPSWWLIELMLMLDYILSKLDVKNIDFMNMQSITASDMQKFLLNVIHFSWKNIVPSHKPPKMLVNLSKLLVSRIKSRSESLDQSIPHIIELYTSILTRNEDIPDEENKNVWLKIMDVILPEIKDICNKNEQVDKRFWVEELIKGFKSTVEQQKEQNHSLMHRWWVTITRNRGLLEPYKHLLLENKFILDRLNTTFKNQKVPYYAMDILLVYSVWMMKDYRKSIVDGTISEHTALTTPDSFAEKREEFIFRLLFDALKKEEESDNGQFMNRAYFLFRSFSLMMGKHKVMYDDINAVIKNANKLNNMQAQGMGREGFDGASNMKRMKLVFIMMNIILVVLHNPRYKDNKEKELISTKIYFDFIMGEITNKTCIKILRYPFLIPLVYHIVKRIVVISDELKQKEYLEFIKVKTLESLKATSEGGGGGGAGEQRNPENGETVSVWISFVLCRVLYELKFEYLKESVEYLVKLMDQFCTQFSNKKNQKDPQSILEEQNPVWDDEKDVLDKMFVSSNVEMNEGNKIISRTLYKGYSIIILRIILRNIDKDAISNFKDLESPSGIKTLLEYYTRLFKCLPSSDYDFKIEILNHLRCLLLPQSVTSSIYKPLAADKQYLSFGTRYKILMDIKLDHYLIKFERRKPCSRIFTDALWKFLVDFVQMHTNCEQINRLIRKLSITDNGTSLSLKQRDVVLNMMNELSQMHHMIKFNLIPNADLSGEFFYVKRDGSGEPFDYVKKYNLLAGAYLGKYGEVRSPLCEKKNEMMKKLFENETFREADKAMDEEKREQAPVQVHIQVKNNEIFKVPDVDIEELVEIKTGEWKKRVESETQVEKVWKGYRYILDMEYFMDQKNTLLFWRRYISQLFEQGNMQERENIWMMLSNILNYPLNSDLDLIFIMSAMSDINPVFLPPHQLLVYSKKIQLASPLAAIQLFEPLLDRTVQQTWNIPLDAVYSAFEDMLEEVKEKDLVLGFRKTVLEKERDQNLLTMIQLRDYHAAERALSDIYKESSIVDDSTELMKNIERHIFNEALVEVKKAMGEWKELFELSKGTERRDLQLESAFFTKQGDVVDNLLRVPLEEEPIVNFVYSIIMLMMHTQQDGSEVHPLQQTAESISPSKKLNDSFYLQQLGEWWNAPKVFCEYHVQNIGLAQMCVEFEDNFVLLSDQRGRKVENNDSKFASALIKLKDEFSFINSICRQRPPSSVDGIMSCKRTLHQRTVMNLLSCARIKSVVEIIKKQPNLIASQPLFQDDSYFRRPNGNILNESFHYDMMYSKVERSFGLYNHIQQYMKDNVVLKNIEEKNVASAADEYYFYHEVLKYWQADSESWDKGNKEKCDHFDRIMIRLKDNSFNSIYRSDLYATLMEGYNDKGMLEKANQKGLEGLSLNEENWRLWVAWFNFYKKMYYAFVKTEKSLTYLKGMLKAFTKGLKYKVGKNLLLFGEVLSVLYFREDLPKGKFNSEEGMKEVVEAFQSIVGEVPVWIWGLWLSNLLLYVTSKGCLKGLEKAVQRIVGLVAANYPVYVYFVLLSLTTAGKKFDETIEEIFRNCANNPLCDLRFYDTDVNPIFALFEEEDLKRNLELLESVGSFYLKDAIDPKAVANISAKCKDIGETVSQFKALENSPKLLAAIKAIDEYLGVQTELANVAANVSFKDFPPNSKIPLLNPCNTYTEKSLLEFFENAYLAPNVKIVYEGRQFVLQVEFLTVKMKKLVYTISKSDVDPVHLFSYNHYMKLLNVQMVSHNETLMRNLKFEHLDMVVLKGKFAVRARPASEVSLIDMLDNEMKSEGLRMDHALELFASKKSVNDVNKTMMEHTSKTILKREVVARLKNSCDLLLWKKKFAQSLGVNTMNSLLFAKGNSRPHQTTTSRRPRS